MLALATAPAWAEWVKVADNDEFTVYADPATIRKNGNLRRAWSLNDLKQRGKRGEMSRRALEEYDCKEEKSRPLSISEHSGPVTTGSTLRTMSSDSDEWDYIAPGSVGETKMKFVCR